MSGNSFGETAAKAKSSSWWEKIFGGLENSWEKSTGPDTHKALQKDPGFYGDKKMLAQLGRVAKKLVPVVERQDLKYHFAILNSDEINAFAVPGGYVYVTKGLMKKIESDDELAGVIGHELGHINKKHGIRQAEKAGVMMLIVALMGAKDETEKYQKAAALAAFFAQMKFSRDDEFEADRCAVKYTYKAGYKPDGIVTFFNKINNDSKLSKITKYFSTHPPTTERIQKVKEEAEKLGYKGETGPVTYTPEPVPQPSSGSEYNVPGIGDIGGGQRYSQNDLKMAYEAYCFTKAQYEYKVSTGAPVDQIMKALKEYQVAKERYFKIKESFNR